MATSKNVSVFKQGVHWATKSDGASRAAGLFDTQAEAIEVAKGIAKRKGGEVSIHGVDGKIRAKHSYGTDPFPPRG